MSQLTTVDDVLLRQINPAFVQDGRTGSSVFKPSRKDNDLLSCSQRTMIIEKESHRVFTSVKNYNSCGIAKVSISEINGTGLTAHASPTTDGPSPEADLFDQAHAHIDFSGSASKSDRENKAKLLAEKARQRKAMWFDAGSNPVDISPV